MKPNDTKPVAKVKDIISPPADCAEFAFGHPTMMDVNYVRYVLAERVRAQMFTGDYDD
jgi:hypothetical protein